MDPMDTPVHVGLIEQRKAKKLLLAQQKKPATQLLERPWIAIPTPANDSRADVFSAKILTWNLLAQCLVRRELFPTSDCLKASQRGHLIHEEIERLDADILCLQEVDRMEKIGPILEKAGYSYRYACGPNKKHGCLIGYKSSMFSALDQKVVYYDNEELSPERESDSQRIGKSFTTRNIGLIVGLQKVDEPTKGVIISTTHLFWHPRYTYERARQAGVLVREAAKFRDSDNTRHEWPSVIAGDFNFTPIDPAYSLLTAATLTPEHKDLLLPSYVVHTSVDPSISISQAHPATDADEGGGGEATDPDRVITNARKAEPSDGLLGPDSLISFFEQVPRARSSYDLGLSQYLSWGIRSDDVPIFGTINATMRPSQPGFYEPAYTSYTHYWKCVLDYIFVLTSDVSNVQITGLLAPLPAKDLDPGLPQKKICPSDHLPLVAEIKFKAQ